MKAGEESGVNPVSGLMALVGSFSRGTQGKEQGQGMVMLAGLPSMKWAQRGVPVGGSWLGSPRAQCLSWAAWGGGGRRQALPSPKARDSFAGRGLQGSALSSGGTIKLRPQWLGGKERPCY